MVGITIVSGFNKNQLITGGHHAADIDNTDKYLGNYWICTIL